MAARIGINGFGRIGREMFRVVFEQKLTDIEVVAINNPSDSATLAHLLKYDSSYGILDAEITAEPDAIIINGKRIRYSQERDPSKIPWGESKVDIVLEATGVFNDKESAKPHMRDTVKKVIFTAAAKGADATICMGVNDETYDPKNHHYISNASCTTNCMAPVMKVLNDNLKVKRAMMTTVHSYTNDQVLQDQPHKDLRRARAANISMIPTTTNAAYAVAIVIPELKDKLNGLSVRVPTPTVSLLDVVAEVEKSTTVEEINEMMKKASAGDMKGIMDFSMEPLVSVDYKKNTHSSIVDGLSTMVMEGNMVKIVAWYDNEWGYSCRVIDMARMVAKNL